MNAELSRRLGRIVGRHAVTPAERRLVVAVAETSQTWDDLPEKVRQLLDEIERRP